MSTNKNKIARRRPMWAAPAVSALAFALFSGGTFASPHTLAGEITSNVPSDCAGAYHYLAPQPGSPANGDTISVGDRFTLDMMLGAGPHYLTAQEAHLTFTHSLLQNVRADSQGCVLTGTITGDFEIFEAPLQNQVCNGPNPCVFGALTREPGSIAWTSVAFAAYNGPDFRVAQAGFCATAPGQARIRWQFAPPAPANTSTMILDDGNIVVSVPSCYVDYVLNIVPSNRTPPPSATSTDTPMPSNTPTVTPTITPGGPTLTPTPTACPGARHYLLPQAGGGFNTSSPLNGGTVNVGDRFTLDMMISAGPYYIEGQQEYFTFTHELLQHVRATSAGCVLTSTVTRDPVFYDLQLQNEVCNAPGPCNFRGMIVPAGSVAYVSSPGIWTPYNGPDFRLAQIGFCAGAPGQAVIHWQFSPPAPRNRNTEILDRNNVTVNVPACYVDYVINIVEPTPTETPAGMSTLVGHLTWQGISQPNSRNTGMDGTLTLCGAGQPVTHTVSTDANGNFTLANLPNGVYNWRFKGSIGMYAARNLATSGTLTLTSGTVNQEFGLQRAGDANNSNIVNTGDFNMLKGMIGKTGCPVPEPGWVDWADFNNDCLTNASDFNLLKNSYGLSGAPPSGCSSR